METIALLTCAVYPRCSKDRNDEASVTEQGELGLARCDSESWEPRLYDGDNDISASRYAKKERKDWPRLLGDLRAGQIGVVWLWESSRGDRKAYEWLGFLEDCRDHGVRIYVETHGRMYDVRVARDWKTLAEDGIANAYRSEESSLQIKRHVAKAAAKGLPHGPADWGYVRRYDPVTRKYLTQEPEPPASEIVEEIITRVARHDPVKAIKTDLDARRIRPPKAPFGPLTRDPWSRATIRKIALNPSYAGCRRQPDGTLVKGWPHIVEMETHLAAVAVLTDPKRSTQRPGRQRHLLTYLATCAGCGGTPLAFRGRYGGRYSCNRGCTYVPEDWLDELVESLVCEALSAEDAAEVFRSDNEKAARLRTEAAALRAELDEWAAADITARAYAIKEARLLPRIEKTEAEAHAAELPLVLRDLLEAEDTRAEWDLLEVPARRAVIRALMTVEIAPRRNLTDAARTDPARVVIGWVHG